ncbi:acyl-CoA reductase LuxC [Pontibacter ummariensis]|uniref:Acyl-CoA reductase (LuxC) n=1 Tax=Pontibacter ummariensis TaxID=1610492 RepID=A0A239EJ47_9BACT|nr:acyl-CoA reductase [Pontibacter ummariensis]PRY13255.1 acyl-CoA reductase LuxC [Pontibacter ummariensis]SNS43894.1 Acyl-CoA reductase (LuxC) [Pontibacter ummariensis]
MTLENRIEAFVALGKQLQNLTPEDRKAWAQVAASRNPWFDADNVSWALDGIITMLDEQYLREWLYPYHLKQVTPKKVGVVMAGNIPMVGFHDFLSVLISGHYLLAKPSSEDELLMKRLANMLIGIEPAFGNRIEFVDLLRDADAIIATGSDNTARYFEHYFAKRPHIIRKNRTSIGVLTGHEEKDDLQALGEDFFRYYGLGCRNVSKVFVPEGYTFDKFFEANQYRSSILDHHKYQNNYDYNKSILLVNRVPHFDNGFMLVQQSEKLVSPISVLFYDTFSSLDDLRHKLAKVKDKTQVVVSAHGWLEGSIPFGEAQIPMVWDYADGVDTLAFLQKL